MSRSSVSFHIPAEGEVNQQVRAWVESFNSRSSRQRSAAIREAIYQYHIRDAVRTLDELHRLVSQQAEMLRILSRQVDLIQAELQQAQRRELVAPAETPPASTRNEEKLKNLTRKFF
jgi:hypothetical protein